MPLPLYWLLHKAVFQPTHLSLIQPSLSARQQEYKNGDLVAQLHLTSDHTLHTIVHYIKSHLVCITL